MGNITIIWPITKGALSKQFIKFVSPFLSAIPESEKNRRKQEYVCDQEWQCSSLKRHSHTVWSKGPNLNQILKNQDPSLGSGCCCKPMSYRTLPSFWRNKSFYRRSLFFKPQTQGTTITPFSNALCSVVASFSPILNLRMGWKRVVQTCVRSRVSSSII